MDVMYTPTVAWFCLQKIPAGEEISCQRWATPLTGRHNERRYVLLVAIAAGGWNSVPLPRTAIVLLGLGVVTLGGASLCRLTFSIVQVFLLRWYQSLARDGCPLSHVE